MNPISLMADAEKLSIGQLQQAVKNGTVPAYIGIPMMQDKMKQAKQAQAPQAPAEPPIAQQVMAQAAGIDQVPSNLPTQAMNDGGIVAFANGGVQDDDDDDAYENYQLAQDEAEHQGIMAQDQQLADYALELAGKSPRKSVNKTPDVEGGIRSKEPKSENVDSGSFYKNMYSTLKEKAEAMGFKNPDAIARVGAAQSALETGHGKYLAGGNNFFGIKGGNNKQKTQEFDPATGKMYTANESFRTYGGMGDSAEDYLRLMQNPRYKNVAMAETPEEAIKHQSRSGYATDPQYGAKLASIHRANMADGGITRLAGGGIAHFYGGGTTSDALGNYTGEAYPDEYPQDVSSTSSPAGRFFDKRIKPLIVPTPEETRARSDFNRVYRQHGEGADISGLFKKQTDQEREIAQRAIDQARANLKTARGGGGYRPPDPYGNYTPETPPVSTAYEGNNQPFSAPANYEGNNQPFNPAKVLNNTETAGPTGQSSGVEVMPRERTAYDEFMDYFKKGHEDLKTQRQEDKYMAILQAGLGMMSGTSPNALANIGQGASMGVAQYGASAKQRAAEQNALMKGAVTAQRYKEMGEDRRGLQKINEARYKDALDYRSTKDTSDLEEKQYKRIQEEQLKYSQLYSLAEAKLTTALKDRYPMGSMSPPVDGIKYEDALAAIQKNPQLSVIRKKAFPELDSISNYPTYDPAKKAYK
jgi:flagellum-specific peptidoglycan hydrolase FlgJ